MLHYCNRLSKIHTNCGETVFFIKLFLIVCVKPALLNITKTYLCNLHPLKPHFYIVELGFTRVYIIFLISAQNINCGYSLELPRRGGSNEYPQSMFWAEVWKNIRIFVWIFFSFLGGKIFNIFEQACFRNEYSGSFFWCHCQIILQAS